jgi:hypothetical protein
MPLSRCGVPGEAVRAEAVERAQARPFDGARDGLLGGAQNRSFDWVQGRSSDLAQDRSSDRAECRIFDWAAVRVFGQAEGRRVEARTETVRAELVEALDRMPFVRPGLPAA